MAKRFQEKEFCKFTFVYLRQLELLPLSCYLEGLIVSWSVFMQSNVSPSYTVDYKFEWFRYSRL
jgi:hypothetical protein